MKFIFVGDRGDLAGVGALGRGDPFDVDQALGEEAVKSNFPAIPLDLYRGLAGEPGTPEHTHDALLALHTYREQLRNPVEAALPVSLDLILEKEVQAQPAAEEKQ